MSKRTRPTSQEHPINAAIRRIAHDKEMLRRDLAETLHVSVPTVFSWFRTRPTKAPMMALELLCLKKKVPFPPPELAPPARKRR